MCVCVFSSSSFWTSSSLDVPAGVTQEEGTYVYIAITCGKIVDQKGKVVNPARGELNRENEHFPVLVCA